MKYPYKQIYTLLTSDQLRKIASVFEKQIKRENKLANNLKLDDSLSKDEIIDAMLLYADLWGNKRKDLFKCSSDYLNDVDICTFKDNFMDMDMLIVMGAQISNTDIKKFKTDPNTGLTQKEAQKRFSNFFHHASNTDVW